MEPTYAQLYPMTRWEERDGFCLVTRGGYEPRRARGWIELDWFVEERGGWRRYRERMEDTWWSDAEIRAALRRSGFGSIRSRDGARIRPRKLLPRRGFDRYYLARKRARD